MTAKHFLVIDDDEAFCAALQRSLSRKGYEVNVAHNLDQAHSCCQHSSPDYAVVDLKIDQESGLNIIPYLRNRFPDIRMLMLTGYSSIATAVDAIKLGADNYLQKPAGTAAILAALEEAPRQTPGSSEPPSSTPSLERMTWEHIQQALKDNNGNVSATARQLGMHRRTLQRKLQKRPVKS